MILGFNHNVMYKGDVFHVQTEDSGVAIPHIITLLYRGGVILSSKKTSYADIIKMDNFEAVVEELMKEQHKDMMRRLKTGEFDERAFPSSSAAAATPVDPESTIASAPEIECPQSAQVTESISQPAAMALRQAVPARPESARKNMISLDDAIVAFFAAYEKQT